MSRRFHADFGPTVADYGRHRAGFPEEMFERLAALGVGLPGQRLLDLGTGTLARSFAHRGAVVTGIDPSAAVLREARSLASGEGLDVDFRPGTAEATGLTDRALESVSAGQCWHWFKRWRALAEAGRVLVPGGSLAICHFDGLALAGTVVAATEELILAHNPDWPGAGGSGFYPRWAAGAAEAGFIGIETFSFDVDQPYSHADGRGPLRASAGVGGSLDGDAVAAFDAELAARIGRRFAGQPMAVPHRCWVLVCRAPASSG